MTYSSHTDDMLLLHYVQAQEVTSQSKDTGKALVLATQRGMFGDSRQP